MTSQPPTKVLAAIEGNRRRLWALCYRMTGNRSEADDLSQEAVARAIERGVQVTDADATGWLFRVTTRVCLDHLRHRKVELRVTTLVDPLEGLEVSDGNIRVIHLAHTGADATDDSATVEIYNSLTAPPDPICDWNAGPQSPDYPTHCSSGTGSGPTAGAIALSPSNNTYARSEQVTITGTLTVGGKAVSGETLSFEVYKPSGRFWRSVTATTHGRGKTSVSFALTRRQTVGIYSVTARVKDGSPSGVGKATFTVVKTL